MHELTERIDVTFYIHRAYFINMTGHSFKEIHCMYRIGILWWKVTLYTAWFIILFIKNMIR